MLKRILKMIQLQTVTFEKWQHIKGFFSVSYYDTIIVVTY